MTSKLETWHRDQYASGGGDPFLFYVIYTDAFPSTPLSSSKYRSNGVPDGIDVMSYGPSNDQADVPGSFRDGYLWEEFVSRNSGLAQRAAACENCIIVRGTPTDATNLNYLRDCVGLITFMLDHGAHAVYDPQMFQWWEPDQWRERIFDPAAAAPKHHVVILFSEEDDPTKKWFHTRGMRKFGRPDISVHHVPPDQESAVIDLCNRLIVHQAFGHIVPEGHQVDMASLPPRAVIQHAGDLDDPDFNNVHLEVTLAD